MAKLKTPERQIAYKVWISDIVNSNYIKQEGWNPNYVELDSKKIARVNIISTVVGKFISEDGNYGTITLDDSTDTIRVKAFGSDVPKISEISIGMLIRFIGKVKKYNDEIYLSPEIIREIEDPNWILVRKLELPTPKSISDEEVKEDTISSKEDEAENIETSEESEETDMNLNIIDAIKSLDTNEGADMEKVLDKIGLDKDEGKKFLFGLLKRGEIYEPKKGKLRVLD